MIAYFLIVLHNTFRYHMALVDIYMDNVIYKVVLKVR